MHARMTKFAGLPPERIDDALAEFKDKELPAIEGHDGFLGVTVLVDRVAGTAAAISLWESEAQMKASEQIAARARESAAATAKPERFPMVDHYEVVVQRTREGAHA